MQVAALPTAMRGVRIWALVACLGLCNGQADSKKISGKRSGGGESFVLKGAGAQAREDGLLAASEGRFADAVPLLQRAVEAPPTGTLSEKLAAARVENAFGGSLKAIGKHEEAGKAFERALKLLNFLPYGGGHDLLVVTNNLGSVHADAGRSEEAEKLYREALKLAEFTDGEDEGKGKGKGDDDDDDDDDDYDPSSRLPVVADTLNNLGDLRHSAGALDEAKAYHLKALEIRERALGPDHADIAASLNNVAVLLMDQKLHADALPLLERAVRVSKNAKGRAHLHATALQNLGGALLKLKRVPEARKNYKRALKINTAALGKEHPSTIAAAGGLHSCNVATRRGSRGVGATENPNWGEGTEN